MTNKEAIKILEVAQVECEWNAPLEYQEAFKMAIEALKAQSEPSTEIQEILNYLDTTLHPIVSPDNWYVYAELHDMVSMLPSAQQWIPCSEKLPDNDESVLISNSHGVTKAWWNGRFWTSIAVKKYKTVNAWMPLPKPYERES